jgi:hypothetical protein
MSNMRTDLKNAADAFKNQMGHAGGADFEVNHYKPEFTALEKMGFVMSGSPHAETQVGLLRNIDNKMSKLIQTVGRGWGSSPNEGQINGIYMDMYHDPINKL